MSSRKWIAYGFFFMIGVSSWIITNGLYLQLPIFVSTLPEQKASASYIVVTTQVGNLVGLFHFIMRSSVGSCQFTRLFSKISVLFTLSLAAVVSILTSLFWQESSYLIDSYRSLFLWTSCALGGVVGSLSTVAMLPFATFYGTTYTSALATGMGFSGIFSIIISLIQSPEVEYPLFGVREYFIILFGINLASILCALIIIHLDYLSIENKDNTTKKLTREDSDSVRHMLLAKDQFSASNCELMQELQAPILNQCYISVMNYLFISLVPYLVKGLPPYTETLLIFWIPITGIFFGALGRAATLKFYYYNLKVTTSMQIVLWVYLMSMCFVQQTLEVSVFWGWLSLCCNAIYSFLYGFADTVNYLQVSYKYPSEPNMIERGSSIMGVSNQVGAIIGSFSSFILVIYYFQS